MVIEFLILDFHVDVDLNFLVLMEVSDKKKQQQCGELQKAETNVKKS